MAKKKSNPSQRTSTSHNDRTDAPSTYYNGDQPNPHLRAFVEGHLAEKPYNPDTDDYDITPGVGSITTSKRTPIYGLHAYDSKNPPDALAAYIRHFTSAGDLVLDPFVGSGMTALASLLAGRKCVAIDASPLATHVTATCCVPLSPDALLREAERVAQRSEISTGHLYRTKCAKCDGDATIHSTVYSQTYKCRRSLDRVALYDALAVQRGFRVRIYAAVSCGSWRPGRFASGGTG